MHNLPAWGDPYFLEGGSGDGDCGLDHGDGGGDGCDDDANNIDEAPSPMLDKQLVLGHPQGAALVPANIVSINKAGKVSRDIIIF